MKRGEKDEANACFEGIEGRSGGGNVKLSALSAQRGRCSVSIGTSIRGRRVRVVSAAFEERKKERSGRGIRGNVFELSKVVELDDGTSERRSWSKGGKSTAKRPCDLLRSSGTQWRFPRVEGSLPVTLLAS
jgi:hypothetical protein